MKRLCMLLLLAALAAAPVIPATPGVVFSAETEGQRTTQPAPEAKAKQDARHRKGKAQPKTAAKASAKASAKTSAKARAAVKAATTARQSAETGQSLTREELLSPYSGERRPSVPAQQPGWASQNATKWFFDTSPNAKPLGSERGKATERDDGGISLRFGPDKRTDPITGEELKRRVDPEGAKDDLKNLDLKGAMDKVGGKAEVQVEILKF